MSWKALSRGRAMFSGYVGRRKARKGGAADGRAGCVLRSGCRARGPHERDRHVRGTGQRAPGRTGASTAAGMESAVDRDSSIVIIGAGIVGSSLADYLTELGCTNV